MMDARPLPTDGASAAEAAAELQQLVADGWSDHAGDHHVDAGGLVPEATKAWLAAQVE